MIRPTSLVCLAALLGCASSHHAPQTAAEPQPAVLGTTPPKPRVDSALPSAQRPAPSAVPKDSSLNDSATAKYRKNIRDSIADAAALDSLASLKANPALPEVPIDAVPKWDLNVAEFADAPRVQYFLDYFSGRGREHFQLWLERMPRFEPFARSRLVSLGLPGDLVYLALIESGFSSTAVSRSKAVGMWQFMAPTGRGMGLRIDTWVDERRDPIKATDAAARHLVELTARFGSPYLAAAAYNAGAGKVERSLGRMSAHPGPENDSLDITSDDAFFSLADTRLIRAETKDYVPKLIAAAIIAKQPEKYQFEHTKGIVPFSLDSVAVEPGTGLDLIAKLADTSIDALRELNPHLLRQVTPPTGEYFVRVPNGLAATVAARYVALPAMERHALVAYVVKAAETVASVAKKYGISADLLRLSNRNIKSTKLTAGTTIYVPLTTAIPATVLRGPASVGSSALSSSGTHVVSTGETLSGIARDYGMSVTSLRSLNKSVPASGFLRVGQKLVVKRPPAKAKAPVVKRGA